MRSLAPSRRSASRPGVEVRARALGEPRAIRYTIGTYTRSRRLDLHQHQAVYRTAAFLFGHVGKHEREESNPVRQDQPSVGARNLPALPGARSCIAPGHEDRGLPA
jgi:hypothetical protein